MPTRTTTASPDLGGQSHRLSYAVVTPARNEVGNLPRLFACLAAQERRPERWIIVDNGSNDGTAEVARELSARHGWIQLEEVETDGAVARGAPVVRAFRAGLAVSGAWDVVVKLDADVSFEPDFFARLIGEFEQDDTLGIAGGVCFEWADGQWVAQHVARSHVRGATRAYRRACLEQILPLEERIGWDGVDEIKAGARGWRVGSISGLPFKHHRALAQRDDARATWLAQGEMAHFMGYRSSYLVMRAVFRSRKDPRAMLMVAGFARAAATRSTVLADRDARRYLRDQQRLRRLPTRMRESAGRI
jgi:glycosyltransferase involved in cell wall biosynthesis